MSKSQKKKEPESQKLPKREPYSFTAYAVCKSKPSANSAQAFEVQIEDGIVTAIKEISRAPDMPVTVIAKAAEKLWDGYRTQYTKDLIGEPQEPARLS